MSANQQIEQLIQSNQVVLFMKGKRRMPQCGFSAKVVSILDQLLPDYATVNVLESPEIREGIKAYSDWPTIPQLYIHGQFVGGADIVTQMFETGQLHAALKLPVPEVKSVTVTVTEAAAEALKAPLAEEGPGAVLRLSVDSQFRPGLDIGPRQATDLIVETAGLTLALDPGSASRADGVSIDFVPGPAGGFRIDNPNEPPRVRPIGVAELKRRLDAGEAIEMVDVRTPEEHAKAHIEGARLMDNEVQAWLHALDPATPVVFVCHHGQRSANAAQHYLQHGFTKVYNLTGGIDAWSTEVDSNVPRY